MPNKPIDCDRATRYAASPGRHRRRSSSRDPSVSRDLKGPVLPGGSNKLKVRFFGGAVAGASRSRYAPILKTGVTEYRRETG